MSVRVKRGDWFRRLFPVFDGPASRGSGLHAIPLPDTGAESSAQGLFRAVPELQGCQPGFTELMARLATSQPYAFCKINHGFWERFARLSAMGIGPDEALARPGAEIDRLLGIAGSEWAEGGMLAELLALIRNLPPPESGLHFAAALDPYPLSQLFEGTRGHNRHRSEQIIRHFVPEAHLRNAAAIGYTGHEIKHAAVTGALREFLDHLHERDVLFVGNDRNRALFDSLALPRYEVIEVSETDARLSRHAVAKRLTKGLEARQGQDRPPVLIIAVGEALSTWLVVKCWLAGLSFYSVDMGSTLAAYCLPNAGRQIWMQTYRRQIAASFPKMNLAMPAVRQAYFSPYGLRDPDLVTLATEAGVAAPASCDEIPTPLATDDIAFIENKPYDHQRMAELLALSVKSNHHANGGPVTALLERMVARKLGLPGFRKVIAVNNGTTALHLATDYHRYRRGKPGMRWVTSASSFFSVNVGPLGGSHVIDCDEQGRFSLDRLKLLPLRDYDGVVYTNVFAQQSSWDDIADFCRRNGKAFVVDNATGLLDRPASAAERGAPIETISAHHTKPWGVGEGGFVLCDESQERDLRDLINFAARLPRDAAPYASNYKISDLAAAAIIDRLERMPFWAHFYDRQAYRMQSMAIDADCGVDPFPQITPARSPRAHSAFLSPVEADPSRVKGRLVLRKYYRPLVQADGAGPPTPNATGLFRRCFSLSNAPEMRLLGNDEIIAAIRTMATEGG